jgi:DNA anti-recombination protein RmuC
MDTPTTLGVIGAGIATVGTVLGAPHAWRWLSTRTRTGHESVVAREAAATASGAAALAAWQDIAAQERATAAQERALRESLERRVTILETQLAEERRLHAEERSARLRAEQRVQDLEERFAALEASTSERVVAMADRITQLEGYIRERDRLASAELQHAIALALGHRDLNKG